MDLPVTIDVATDTAGFLIFHPDDLAHRWSEDLSWAYGDEFAVEARAGRILGWVTGSDGDWGIRLTDRAGELPLVPGRSAEFLLEVRHGRVLLDDNSDLPNNSGDPDDEPHESRWINLANGRYRVRVSLVDAVPHDGVPEYEVLFRRHDDTELFTQATEVAPLRPDDDTLGRVVNDWRAHPADPVVSAYERWLIALDSGEAVANLPNTSGDGAPADPPTPPRRTLAPPSAADSVADLRRLIADVCERKLVRADRRAQILAGRLLTYPGVSGWLREHLELSADEAAELDAQSRQSRFDALLTRLRDLAATPAEVSELAAAEQRLLRPVPSLDRIELPTEPVIIFRDPPELALPGATLQLSVPPELADVADNASYVGLLVTAGVDPTGRPAGYPGIVATVRSWEPSTATLTVETYAGIRCFDRAVADRPVSTAKIAPGGSHPPIGLPADLTELRTTIATAAERDPVFAAGPPGSVPADRLAEFRTVPGVAEWLLRALPMRPALRLQLFLSRDDLAGPELVAQLRALADPSAITELEAELLTVRPWITALPPGPLHIATGAAHLPGTGDVLRDQTPHYLPYELFSPTGRDGDLATLNELVTAPIPGPPGHFEHCRQHLGLVRIARSHIGSAGLVGLAEPTPEPPPEDVEDIVDPAALATFVTEHLGPGSGLAVPAIWNATRLHSARAVSAWLLRELDLDPHTRLTLVATPPRERLHLLLDRLDAHAEPGRRIVRSERPDSYPAYEALVESQPGLTRSEVPLLPTPLIVHEDSNFVVGEPIDLNLGAAVWPEVSRHRHAVFAGSAADGAYGLLVRVRGSDPQALVLHGEAIGVVRMSAVARRPDGGWQAMLEEVPAGPDGDLDTVIERAELRDLVSRAAVRDPTFVTGWLRPVLRSPQELSELAVRDVAEDLLRRLVMPLSTRTELATKSERDRFQTLITMLREVADGTPPEPQVAQRLARPLIDLPPHGIPVLAHDLWLTPGNVSTISGSAFICREAFAAGWLAITTELRIGRAVMATRPVRRSETTDAGGWYQLTTDQIRPAVIRAVTPGREGRSLVELDPAPSAAEAVGRGLPEPGEERERLGIYVELLRRAYARDTRVVGAASGRAYRLWQASRFTSLRALLAWQIGQLGFGAQAVLDLQAIAWPDRLRALTHVLQGVADGHSLPEVTVEAAEMAAAALDD